jgi:hypothetical protein
MCITFWSRDSSFLSGVVRNSYAGSTPAPGNILVTRLNWKVGVTYARRPTACFLTWRLVKALQEKRYAQNFAGLVEIYTVEIDLCQFLKNMQSRGKAQVEDG